MSAISFQPYAMSLSDGATTELVYATLVSGTFFDVLGTARRRGDSSCPKRTARPGRARDRAQSRLLDESFQGDPAAVGTSLTLERARV